MEATWFDRQQPRFAEHFEPILIPLAALFWLWDDVRILLIAQAFALALGALPVYWLAKSSLSTHLSSFSALLFPLLYLLNPALQAAAVADLHADPFVVAPFLFAFWYITQNRWKWMWVWAIVVMAVKETMPTLVVMLGIYLIIHNIWLIIRQQIPMHNALQSQWQKASFIHGLRLTICGAAWFLIATFFIVAPLAEVYFASEGPIYLTNRFSTKPVEWLMLLQDSARWRYLGGLIWSTGGLALFAPHYLLLGLPIFIANTLSNFPGQYSGEQHYSAPLVAVLMIAAIYGYQNILTLVVKIKTSWFTKNLRGNRPSNLPKEGEKRQSSSLWGVREAIILALLIALLYHILYGWTPLSYRAEVYTHTAHTRLLPSLVAQILPEVPISASAAVHPHLAHRPVAYVFPHIGDAAYILVDILDVPGHHPNDIRLKLLDLLNSEQWTLLQATNGFLLLKRQPPLSPFTMLPDSFYDFARHQGIPQREQEYPLNLTFGETLRLLGFDVIDDAFHHQTKLRFYWQALSPERPQNLKLWYQFFDDFGQILQDSRHQPSLAALWYPPYVWQSDEIVRTETLSQNFGERFHLAVGVSLGDDFMEASHRLLIQPGGQTWLHIASFQRHTWSLQTMAPQPPNLFTPSQDIIFEQGLHLTGFSWPQNPVWIDQRPGQALPFVLRWEIDRPLKADYTIFIHLVASDGTVVAQSDSQPFWIVPNPSSGWPVNRVILDQHLIALPLPPGTYQVLLGLYTWPSLEHLSLQSDGDAIILGKVTIRNDQISIARRQRFGTLQIRKLKDIIFTLF